MTWAVHYRRRREKSTEPYHLENPVNHRVFEHKLHPKRQGRGHVCLGVTHRSPKPRPPPD
ncbi:hypothetical protein G2W53_027131 [Senna tora]|uniref:Uncharacterized protein n=1 Tax=Senna tora TaxID=362788 RepID=A0A834WJG8_9FABA|nr:hypothetical protein G2W53_027131 [Senna tora]